VALTEEGLNGLGIHLINETAKPVRAKLALRCYQNGEIVVMRRDRDVELPARSNQTLSSTELIGSFFDITHAYRFGPPALDVTAVTLDDAATGERIADAAHFPQERGALKADPELAVELIGGDRLKIHATRFAACVQIEDAEWRAEDEGFNLQPGEERIVRLLRISGTATPSGAVRATNGESEVRYACP
jgi:beta-mannosidase